MTKVNPESLLQEVYKAEKKLRGVTVHTPLDKNETLSTRYHANIFLKREDLQPVRSYKLRGAFNKISFLTAKQKQRGVVCASAGNHAQGVAFTCNLLGIRGTIFMPETTPRQKVKRVSYFGKGWIKVVLTGDTFDDAYAESLVFAHTNFAPYIHPFDDEKIIAGQGTTGLEILADLPRQADYLFVPVGGGGLAAGLCTVFSQLSRHTKIIGTEPSGAASMKTSIEKGENTALDHIDRFVDGAAVKRVGDITFDLCKNLLYDSIDVSESQVCHTLLQLLEDDALVAEPAGVLSIAALEKYKEHIGGKTVVCILSGSNHDNTRMEEIKARALKVQDCLLC